MIENNKTPETEKTNKTTIPDGNNRPFTMTPLKDGNKTYILPNKLVIDYNKVMHNFLKNEQHTFISDSNNQDSSVIIRKIGSINEIEFMSYYKNHDQSYYGYIENTNLLQNGFGKHIDLSNLDFNYYYLGYFSNGLREGLSMSISLQKNSSLSLLLTTFNIKDIYRYIYEHKFAYSNILSSPQNPAKEQIKENTSQEKNIQFFFGNLKNIENSKLNITDSQSEGKYLRGEFNENNTLVDLVISKISYIISDGKPNLTRKSGIEVENSTTTATPTTNTFTPEKRNPVKIFNLNSGVSLKSELKQNIRSKINNKLNLKYKDYKSINFRFFYGSFNEELQVEIGFLLINSINEGRSIYQGKLKNNSLEDENGLYYQTDKKLLYKGVFKNNSFVKGKIAKNIDERLLKKKREIEIYDYNSETSEITRDLQTDLYEEAKSLVQLIYHDYIMNITIDEQQVNNKDKPIKYKTFSYLFELFSKSIAHMIFPAEDISENEERTKKGNNILFNNSALSTLNNEVNVDLLDKQALFDAHYEIFYSTMNGIFPDFSKDEIYNGVYKKYLEQIKETDIKNKLDNEKIDQHKKVADKYLNPIQDDFKNIDPARKKILEDWTLDLYTAMDNSSTKENEDLIIKITKNTTKNERLYIAEFFQTKFNKTLYKFAIEKIKGSFTNLLVYLYRDSIDNDVELINKSQTVSSLIDVFASRTSSEILKIKVKYLETYKNELIKDLQTKITGFLFILFKSLLENERSNGTVIEKKLLDEDISIINKVLLSQYDILKEIGNNNDLAQFVKIFALRSNEDFKNIYSEYFSKYNIDLRKHIKERLKGEELDLLTSIIEFSNSKFKYFANKIDIACKGLGTNEEILIRIISFREQIDLNEIAKAYKSVQMTSLYDTIDDECSGKFKNLILSLIDSKW